METENTLESIQKALDLGVDAIEFDVWTTKDGVPAVHHDESLLRITGDAKLIPHMTWDELKKIRTRDGKVIPTAKEAIELIGSKPFLFEIKDRHLTNGVLELLKMFKDKEFMVTSFEWPALLELKQAMPNLRLYTATVNSPFRTIIFAHKHKLHGVNLKYYWLNPFTYLLAKHYGLKIKLYTVNSRLYVKLLRALKLKVDFTTDFPDRFVKR